MIQSSNLPVQLLITSPAAALPSGTILVDVSFEVNAQLGSPTIVSKNGEFGVRPQDVKLTPEQQQSLEKAVRSLLEQCQFELTFDQQASPIDRPKNYVLDAQIQIQVI